MTLKSVQHQYDQGRLTSHDAICKILRTLDPERVDELADLDTELASKLRQFTRTFDPHLRSTGEMPTEEQVALVRRWYQQHDRNEID